MEKDNSITKDIIELNNNCRKINSAINEILHFGLENYNPDNIDKELNRSLLERDIGNILATIDIMVKKGIISKDNVNMHKKSILGDL